VIRFSNSSVKIVLVRALLRLLNDLLLDTVDTGSGVHHDGLSGVALSLEASRHGESGHSRRSGRRGFLVLGHALKGDKTVRLDDLGHTGGHHVGYGSLPSEGRSFLKFSSLAGGSLLSILKPTLTFFQSGLLRFLGKDLIDELYGVLVGQVVVELSSRLHHISSTGGGNVGQLVTTVCRHRSR